MDQRTLEQALADLPLGSLRYFPQVGSTNDEAARWAAQGAPPLSLVLADEQTAGRGRAGHKWITPPGSALAFSVILYPEISEDGLLPRLTALGALAVCDALHNTYHLAAQIKWPNDVLLNGRKVAGVLAEAQWMGDTLVSVVVGIGINVASESVSEAVLPASALNFPATSIDNACIEDACMVNAGQPVNRLEVLHAVLAELLSWQPRLATPDFIRAWEARLAFRGEWVQVWLDPDRSGNASLLQEGQLTGVTPDGSLMLTAPTGEVVDIGFGEVRLRPVNAAVSRRKHV